jgi:phosphoribosylanthranilate isomerase
MNSMAFRNSFPKIKFCGLTRVEDITEAIDCGTDAIGINFVPSSPRCVSISLGSELVRAISGRALAVGVFVNADPIDVSRIVEQCGLDCVQLHGDEQPGWVTTATKFPALKSIPLIKAVSWQGMDSERQVVMNWVSNPVNLWGFLVDAFDPIQRGGTGRTARWELLSPRPTVFRDFPILLAGGLKPGNISQAIQSACPDGIDVASGIELSPGIKDPMKMKAIADIAKRFLVDRMA